MALSFKHNFQSAKGDGTDPSLIQPSYWNAEHIITLATDTLMGRSSPGTGNAQEITCTAFGRSMIATTDLAAFKVLLAYGALAAKTTADYADVTPAAVGTAPEFTANTTSKLLAVASVWTAATPTVASANGTVNLDFSTLINKAYTITGPVTLTVTNAKPGQSGVIEWTQDSTVRALTLGTGQFAYTGTAPNFVQVANAKFMMGYYVRSDGKVFISMNASGLSFS